MHEFSWRPGIGDPTLGGWITVVLYVLAMLSCWMLSSRLHKTESGFDELRAWRLFAILFLLLGINKQLDLQSALTDLSRIIAWYQGWYGQRSFVQEMFIATIAVSCAVALVGLAVWFWHAPAAIWVSLLGITVLLSFVLIRAASFHHVDRFIRTTALGLRWNWILEMGGIGIVLAASIWRRRQTSRLP